MLHRWQRRRELRRGSLLKYGLLKINTKFLPKEIQPSTTRKVLLVFMALFYGYFVYLFLKGGFPVDTDKGFIFNFVELMTETE